MSNRGVAPDFDVGWTGEKKNHDYVYQTGLFRLRSVGVPEGMCMPGLHDEGPRDRVARSVGGRSDNRVELSTKAGQPVFFLEGCSSVVKRRK